MRPLLASSLAFGLLASFSNAAVAIQTGAEVLLDKGVQGEKPGDYSIPRAAFGAGVHFVIWPEDNARILGARLDASGKTLDLNPLVLVEPKDQLDTNDIGFGGQNFLIAWLETGYGGNTWSGHIRVARVTPQGKVLDPGGIQLTSNIGDHAWPQITFDGTNFLVVWRESNGSFESDQIWGRRVSQTGTPIEAAPVELAKTKTYTGWAASSFNGQSHLVAWTSSESALDSVKFRRFGTNLAPLDGAPKTLVDSTSSVVYIGSPLVSNDGSSWLVAWDRAGLETARIDSLGNAGTIQPASTNLSDPYGIAYGAGSYFVNAAAGFAPNVVIATQRYDLNGAISGAPVSLGPKETLDFPGAISFSGSEFVTTYANGGYGKQLVRAARISATGAKVADVVLSQSINEEKYPEIAYDGSGYLAVWSDTRGDGSDVYGIRLDATGSPAGASAFPIAQGAGDQVAPAVAWDGNEFVVVWNDDQGGDFDVRAARVSTNGALLDPTPKVVSAETGHQLLPRIASGGDGKSYVVWEDHRTSGFLKIYGARLTGADSQDAGGVSIASDIRDRYMPSITFGGGTYLVVWSDERNLQTDENVFAARIGVDGKLLDASGIELSAEAGIEHSPRATYDGKDFVVSWRRYDDGAVFVRRVDLQGQPLGTAESLATNLGAQTPAAIEFDGKTTLVAFEAAGELRGATLVANAAPETFSIAPSADQAEMPALASDANGRALVVYSRPDPTTGALRAAVRTLNEDDVPPVGGTGGTGGGAGGAVSSGGSGGAAASAGTGAKSSTGGSAGSPAQGGGSDGGCGCQIPEIRSKAPFGLLAILLVGLARRRHARRV